MQTLAEPVVGIVTFTVDNVTEEFFDTRMPAFFERDIPGTVFGQTQPITGAPGDMTWDDVRSLAGHGWEFGAHGYTHAYMLTKASDEVLEMELGVPAAQIYVATGIYPVNFASPKGDYDDRVLERARFYYKAHFRGWGNEGINRFDQTDHWQIYREQVANTKSIDQICAEMERAGREGYWLVYMWHRVVDKPTTEYENSVVQFEGVLDCAASLRDRGIVRLMTARDALKVVPDTPRSPD
jgi:peptidoglycan/xylan/chitin deacetylase (PgdA/CDA1 family)